MLSSYTLLKFEGIEGKNTQQQLQQVLYQLSKYLSEPYIAKLNLGSWLEFFDLLADKYNNQPWILYLEELQWLANYENGLISELKYAWDNTLRHKQNFLLVLRGSSPSFMINQVVHSKALYNRSLTEIHLQEFSISETKLFLAKSSHREVMNAYLTIGGVNRTDSYKKFVNLIINNNILTSLSIEIENFNFDEQEIIQVLNSLVYNYNLNKIELSCRNVPLQQIENALQRATIANFTLTEVEFNINLDENYVHNPANDQDSDVMLATEVLATFDSENFANFKRNHVLQTKACSTLEYKNYVQEIQCERQKILGGYSRVYPEQVPSLLLLALTRIEQRQVEDEGFSAQLKEQGWEKELAIIQQEAMAKVKPWF